MKENIHYDIMSVK